ncbi:putative S-adenosylmethionine decarboxylase proenzyme [Trypanosoma grayi]|uniref:putative S-adenosylmethionine decarboxylase proenzyme n=1 Tax=Trypanosoma grayi TaxID=71804 RepID=UPI0004F46487|nr:putative S-adenosylmethionine decarboxylase proenzyme [Trypanosoma grayi]KEG14435.1 putative S-adenosylmethionine decarboxylase proenzyme [Trypanosoma grayi]
MAMWGSVESYTPKEDFSFEGPEKRLEVIMRLNDETHVSGLLALDDEVWAGVVGALDAQIVSKESNAYIRSYVLTESSLFVKKDRIILITCGRTTLLNSIPNILEAVSTVRGEPEWVSFMHKNYSFPWEQKGPHHTMEEEFNRLKAYFPSGHPFIIGPVDSDHYFLFLYHDIILPCQMENDTQLSMTMYGLDREQTKHWFSDKFVSTSPETAAVREVTKLAKLMDDSWVLHDLLFEPCGYSINAIRGEEYQTIHITPEDHCSFASYETNTCVADYSERMSSVLEVFRPSRFTVIVFIDPDSDVGKLYHKGKNIGVEPEYYSKYDVQHRTVNEFAPGYVALKINYVRRPDPDAASAGGNTIQK